MKQQALAHTDIPALLSQGRYSREHLMLMLDQFADRLDNRTQSQLFGELMARYADISRALEETVAQLARSDASRLEAQRIAMLGNWSLNLATRTLLWSETTYEIFELPPNVLPGRDVFFGLLHPDDLHKVATVVDQFAQGVVPKNVLFRLRLSGDRVKWLSARFMGSPNAAAPEVIYGTIQDVTKETLSELKLKKYNDDLEVLVQEKIQETLSAQLATIYALVKLAESRDDDTGEHIERMSRYCQFAAQTLQAGGPYASQVDDAFVRNIALASPLHDIGKVGVPDGILLKPGRLTPDEFTIMKTHVTIGYNTLASVVKNYPGNAYLRMGMDIARYHHEKWDGSGYQDGLAGEDIPLSARILTLCDVYDALRSRRVYKEPYSHERSVEIIVEGKGKHFDPELVDMFVTHNASFAEIYRNAKTTS